MFRLFGHFMSVTTLCLLMLEGMAFLASFYIGYFVRFADLSSFWSEAWRYAPEAGTFVFVNLVTLIMLGAYERTAMLRPRIILVRSIAALLSGFVILTLIYYLFPALKMWRSSLFITLPLALAMLLTLRWLYLWLMPQGRLIQSLVVIGTGEKAGKIDKWIAEHPELGMSVCCFLHINGEGKPEVSRFVPIEEVDNLFDFCREKRIDEIVVALDERRGNMPLQSLLECRLSGFNVVDYQGLWERETGRIDLSGLSPGWLVFSDGLASGPFIRFAKRCFDILVSLIMLLLVGPILLSAMLAVWLQRDGPVFYRQERVGADGRIFDLLKLRTMRSDAESDGRARWAAEGDHRITPVGKFLRRTRIDELPQLYNIFNGEMSLIGPRPERPEFVDQLTEVVPFYADRHRIKPGLGGWAQLNYPYGASIDDARAKLEYDLYYIKNGSLFLDVLILLQTMGVVVWGKGQR